MTAARASSAFQIVPNILPSRPPAQPGNLPQMRSLQSVWVRGARCGQCLQS